MAHFPAPIGRYIVLQDKVYVVDAIGLDFTGYTFVFAERSAIVGINQNVNSLVSSEDNATFFMSTSYNLFMNAMEVYMNGANQTVWEHIGTTGNESFEINQFVVYGGGSPFATGTNSKMGHIETIRQGFMGTCFFWGVDDGFECAGHWVGGGLRISNTLWLGCSGKFYYSDPLDPVIFDTRFSSNANVTVPVGSVGYDFPETAFTYDGQYQLQNGNAQGDGVIVTDWSGKSPAFNPRANFKNNNGIQNTFPGGEWINNVDTTTVIGTKNVWYQINLSTGVKGLTWFSESGGVFTMDSSNILDIIMFLTLTVVGKANDIVEAKLVKRDALLVETDILIRQITIKGTLAQGRAESVPLISTDSVTEDDDILVYIRNTSGTSNVTTLIGSNMVITAK